MNRRGFISIAGGSVGLILTRQLFGAVLTAPTNFRMISTAWPDATNTGVPSGTTLTNSGTITTTSAGQVIQNLNVTGGISVAHNNVTIRNCRVTGIKSWAVIEQNGSVTGTLIEDCEADGERRLGSYGIGVSGTVRRCNVHGVENGLNPQSGSLYENNWVWGLNPTGTDPHSDACPAQGGTSNVIVRHNTLDITGSVGFNATFFINSYFGNTDNFLVDNNLMIGVPAATQGFNIYSYRYTSWGTLTNVRFTNNIIRLAPWGIFLKMSAQSGYTDVITEWTNNTNYLTGAVIPNPLS
jgi:hypothetical protein